MNTLVRNTEYEPLDPRFIDDRYELYNEMLQSGPVHLTPSGQYVVTRYDDVKHILAHPEIFSSAVMAEEMAGFGADFDPESDPKAAERMKAALSTMELPMEELAGARSMPFYDPPVHTEKKRVVVRDFIPRAVNALVPEMGEMARECLSDRQAGEPWELYSVIGRRFPVMVIARLLGLGPEHYERIVRWTDDCVESGAMRAQGIDDQSRMVTMLAEFSAVMVPLIEERRVNPGDDLVSTMVRNDNEAAYSMVEAVLFANVLLMAGNDTTSQAMSTLVVWLLQDRDLLVEVLNDKAEMDRAISEALRLSSPAQFVYRNTVCETQISGVAIPEGATVVVNLGAANRDPHHFPDPEKFDITRPNLGDQLAFGHGIHKCVGQHFAKAELHIAMNALADELPNLSLAKPPTPNRRSGVICGYEEVWLTET